ncbi:hypothetical protein [Microbacterium immunditiarum]|uniref:Uncharacterized protein n=1 Tax=Microbacterium immunditiarum TaxID=337480 RepID=A0A7Y9GRZ9_9MICO|nr:hypothetical protein [Microbacterium immunditiarum]NYE21553.1 hypothetical protein [Microbacterium immunditiarum]
MIDAISVLEEMTADAVSVIERAAGGASVCSFTKSGVPVPGVKYAEGRWVALRELKLQGATPAAVAQLSATWRERLSGLHARDAGSDWLAYASGGVDALAEFHSRLAAEPWWGNLDHNP